MKFTADLHIHSKYSRATAKNCDLEHLYIGAQLKGINVLATGDFTHPEWFKEIQEKLVMDEPGLFKLKDDIAKKCNTKVPLSCQGKVRFILETEISNIYKKNGKTRKNHNLIYMPDMETAVQFNAKLDSIGNIKSDGRPILGLDAKNLLEIMLECSDQSFFIPAHIWTPWFSLLGSKSGFDSIEECFEDLSDEIFAVETGLSSDAPMNWRISELDTRTLVSNSDAHSPANLARNANIFNTEFSFSGIKSALKSKNPNRCLGTLDMYPEEGKYHMDGHRKCNICLHPSDSILKNCLCPVCNKPLVLGVLHRVEALADRPEGVKPENTPAYKYIIPLPEILSEIFNVGPKTKTVNIHYENALNKLGNELDILLNCEIDKISKTNIPLLSEAVKRMRERKIHILPGYDGEYGTITVFTPEEREKLLGQQSLFNIKGPKPRIKPRIKQNQKLDKIKKSKSKTKSFSDKKPENNILNALNNEQQNAVKHQGSPLLIIAGPGAGKTRTLTHKIAWLIKEKEVDAKNILALTFTNKAAAEMQNRVVNLLCSQHHELPTISTFHALCFKILKKHIGTNYTIIDDEQKKALINQAVNKVESKIGKIELKLDEISDMIVLAKQKILSYDDDLRAVAENKYLKILSKIYKSYQEILNKEKIYDYDDLIFNLVKLFESDTIRNIYINQFKYILVDEYQDLNLGQYKIIRALSPENKELYVIGDPDQSIYGFRGSDLSYFQKFTKDYPNAHKICLTKNYRSSQAILQASHQVMKNHSITASKYRVWSDIQGIKTLTILELANEKAEAIAVGKTIEKMMGGTGFHSIDFGKIGETEINTDCAFSDFAILYRSNAQAQIIQEILENAGIPCQVVNKSQVYGQKGIKELISYLKIIEEKGIFVDFQTIALSQGDRIGHKTLEIFKKWFYDNAFVLPDIINNFQAVKIPEMTQSVYANFNKFINKILKLKNYTKENSIEQKIKFILENTNLMSMINKSAKAKDTLDSIFSKAKAFENNADGFFEILALQTDPDIYDINAEKVSLMTLHASKGLEFPVVFITGCEDDYLPFRRSKNAFVDVDEERRLFYVGMTRAKDQLFLTHVRKRNIYGKYQTRQLSHFVKDIEKKLISFEQIKAKKAKKAKKEDEQFQLGLFN